VCLPKRSLDDKIESVAQAPTEAEPRKVWDLPVRVFHWTLVAASLRVRHQPAGVSYFKYHVWFGYTVIVLVLFRIVWALSAPVTRSSGISFAACATLRYVLGLIRGHEIRYAGHNPWAPGWCDAVDALGIQAFSACLAMTRFSMLARCMDMSARK